MSLQLAINVLTVYMHYGWSPQKTQSQATAPLQGAHLMILWSSLRSAQLAIDPILVVAFWARLLANLFRIWHQSVTPTLHTSPLGSPPSVKLAFLTLKHSNSSDHIAPTHMSDKRQYIPTSLEIGIPPSYSSAPGRKWLSTSRPSYKNASIWSTLETLQSPIFFSKIAICLLHELYLYQNYC